MGEKEAVSQEPEEAPVKQWHYDWPEGELIEQFNSAAKLSQWVTLCTSHKEVLGDMGAHLTTLMQGDRFPSPDELESTLKHPLVGDRMLRLCNETFQSNAGTLLQDPLRALVLLGAKTARNLSFIVCLYNRLLVEPTPKGILPEIVKSYLAGVYAVLFHRSKHKILNAEEIFVAASMHYLGRLLFWYFGGEKAKAMEKVIKAKQYTSFEIEQDIFGFSSYELTKVLVKQWSLGDTIQETFEQPDKEDNQAIRLAIAFTNALFEGHSSQNFFVVKREVASTFELSADQMQDIILEGLERVIEGLVCYDCPDLIDYVPYPKEPDEAQQAAQQEKLEISTEFFGEPDLARVQSCINTLVKMPLMKSPDMNELMHETVDGLLEGGDFDRVMIAFLETSRKKAHSKFISHAPIESFQERFNLEISEADFFQPIEIDLMKAEGYLLRNILRESKIAWVGSTGELVLRKLRNNAFNRIFGRGQFFIAPIVVKGHKLGFYFCDRQPSHRKLDIKSYDAFMDICLQANKSLELIRASNHDNPS